MGHNRTRRGPRGGAWLALVVLFAAAWGTCQGAKLYEVLGIEPSATHREVRKAYRGLALQFHPDKASSADEAKQFEERFITIANAYEVLGDEERRKEYDAAGGDAAAQDGRGSGFSSFDEAYAAYAHHAGGNKVVQDTPLNMALMWVLVGLLVGPAAWAGWQQLGERQRKAEAKAKREAAREAERQRLRQLRLDEVQTRKKEAAERRERSARAAEEEARRQERAMEGVEDLVAAAAAREIEESERRAQARAAKRGPGAPPEAASGPVRPGEAVLDAGKRAGAEWTAEELAKLSRALKRFPAGTQRRWDCVAAAVGGGRTGEEAASVVKQIKLGAVGGSTPAGGGATRTAVAAGGSGEGQGDVGGGEGARGDAAAAAEVDDGVVAGAGDFWTQSEQDALEAALREAAEEGIKGGDKWLLVSDRVPTRSVDECRRRVARLRKALRRKGGGGAAGEQVACK
ncbi:hypothetical protein FNF27_01460 [Cafeteria roenbergensis]|uniref:J domain-containing protein n=1 Tax=Cafeteria roenbergensis TaxID=33653 RepID=A0A5A8EME2_CAFRO|nr:hypothetical protein FNF27_01460 [Cafeteria roenbergensis]